MKERRWELSLPALRVVTLIAPPIALILLWKSPKTGLRAKILGSIGIPLFQILHLAVIVWGLHVLAGIDLYEWRGGYIPTLTFNRTLPDYDALESHRKRSAGASEIVASDSVYWTGFRGPNRDGVYAEKPISTSWKGHPPRLLWRQPIGGGYASFAVVKGVAFTIEQRRSQEAVTAYEVATGRELWAHAWEADFRESIGGDGPRATPTWSDGRVFAQGATGELRCLEAANGNLVWRHDVLRENGGTPLEYGCSASPLVVDDLVLALPGGSRGRSIVAYDRLTGEVRWAVGDDRQAYVSPMVASLAGERQLLVVAAQRTMGLTVSEGRLLWEFPWGEPRMGRNVAQPAVWNGDRFLLSAGYDVECVAVEVGRNARGFSARELWRNKSLKNKFSSSVFWKGHLYGLDEEILTCVNAATGERAWKDGRYGYGQLLLADGHLVILCANGDLALVKATPEKHEEIARIPAIKGKTWNHPALADGKLLVRNLVEMACFDLSVP
jgi:outer membrane protein assembly factor BamB